MPATSRLRITSTSLLPPAEATWEQLARSYVLDFGSFGDWPQALLSGADAALLWVLVLEDVVAPETVVDSREFAGILRPLLEVLARRLETAPDPPTMVAWLAWRPDSPIRSAKTRRLWKRLGERLSGHLRELADSHPSLLLLDLDELFARPGLDVCLDPRNWYAARCRFSRRGIEELSKAVSAILARVAGARRKLIVLDCDNTLWGGIVGETGLKGLVLGQDGLGRAFVDFQRSILRLAHQGLLLALSSKNNEADVWTVFNEHPAMVLASSDLVAWRINWQDKAANVAEIANDLGLGLEAVIFLDDNPLEREKMRALLPQVLTPELPADVVAWPWFVDSMDEAANFHLTAEDAQKTEQYRQRSTFLASRESARDELEFLRTIELKPRAVPISAGTVSRAAQLCAKTNQFNLRTGRCAEGALLEYAASPRGCVFLTHLSDRFGDHGLIGVAVALPSEAREVAFLDTFLLSCRVLGRHVEAWMLRTVVDRLLAQGIRWLIAEFRPTARNTVAQDFLISHGFSRWCDLPEQRRHLLHATTVSRGVSGEVFVAELESITVPYSELFNYAQSNTH